MENNTSKSKKLLEQALKLMPRDFALSNARAYLNRAISEVSSVEAKRIKKEKISKTIEENSRKYNPDLLTPKQQKIALSELDKMIETEENKLKELRTKKENKTEKPSRNQQING